MIYPISGAVVWANAQRCLKTMPLAKSPRGRAIIWRAAHFGVSINSWSFLWVSLHYLHYHLGSILGPLVVETPAYLDVST